MAGISSAGLGSGLDINSIVSQLVQAEGAPKSSRLNQKEAQLQAELSAIGLLKSALSDFQSSLSGLQSTSDFLSRSASSSDSDIATISADEDAVSGSYQLEVSQLADNHKLISAAIADTSDVGSGTLTITSFGDDKLAPSDGGDSGDGSSFSIDTSAADADSDGIVTLEELKDAINNASDNIGVTATILTADDGAHLVLSSDNTGLANAFEVTNTFSPTISNLADPNDDNYAKDAQIKVDGQTVTSSTNTFVDAIEGATITAKATNVGETIDLTVSLNTGSAKSKINSFVDAYNKLQEVINEQTKYDEASGATGSLFADPLISGIQRQIRSIIGDTVDAVTGTYDSLASIGITTTTSGTLEVDSSKLDDAVDADIDAIAALFGDEEGGIANRLDSALEGYLKFDGTFDDRTDSINRKIEDIADQREQLALRLEKFESRTLAQFIAMDQLVASLNNTGDWLASQLETLPGVVRQNSD